MSSDQGSHFTCEDYVNLLKENSIKISMDGKGRALDNQWIERFFRSYKWEKLYVEEYEIGYQLKRMTQEYIEYYNRKRPHQSLDYRISADYYLQHRRYSNTGCIKTPFTWKKPAYLFHDPLCNRPLMPCHKTSSACNIAKQAARLCTDVDA